MHSKTHWWCNLDKDNSMSLRTNPDLFIYRLPDIYAEFGEDCELYLMLGCDGCFDYVADKDYANLIQNLLTSNTKPEEIPAKLINLAFQNGSKDNLTCLFTKIKKDAATGILFGVFDGHGSSNPNSDNTAENGHLVSTYIAMHFEKIWKNIKQKLLFLNNLPLLTRSSYDPLIAELNYLSQINVPLKELAETYKEIHETKSLEKIKLEEINERLNKWNTKISLEQIKLSKDIQKISGITRLTDEAIRYLSYKNVLRLDLSNNYLSSIPDKMAESLPSITVLDLSNNQLRKIPANLHKLQFLFDINLHNNSLQSLPESISLLTKLFFLKISNNKIIFLPETIGDLKELSSLDARNNQLTILPPGLCSLKKLNQLYLQNNALESLPDDFHKLGNLTTVHLQDNQLRYLPKNFWLLTAIKYLDLTCNKLICLPTKGVVEYVKYHKSYHSNPEIYIDNNLIPYNILPKIKDFQIMLKLKQLPSTPTAEEKDSKTSVNKSIENVKTSP